MSNFPLKEAADHLATRGRYGDSMLVHMNPIEVDALSKLSPTGQLTINPDTGQPEAFLPLLGSMLAPSLLGAAGIGAALSPLAASAIGTGLGTIAEGGSLKEGITAGLMGGLTGGLLGKMMPATGTEIAEAGAATGEAAQAALPKTSTIADLNKATGVTGDTGFFSRIGQNLGFMEGATGAALEGATPTGLTQTQAMMGQALPAAASGLVGEMYVPYDMEMPEDDDPYAYEGPYMPTEQRTMMGEFDPMGSAFMGEQDMIGGNVLPDAPNFNMGGLIKMANGGSPAQRQIQESAETLERRKLDQELRDQLARSMSAPMVDPRIGRMADPISTPVTKTLDEVMTPEPYQAPSLAEIKDIQSAALDMRYLPQSEGGALGTGSTPELDRMRSLNRKYNPLLRGIEAIAPYPTKAGLEVYEAIDEFRKRNR